MSELTTAQPAQEAVVDDTNHDLVHALSVRLDARWHDSSYGSRRSARAAGACSTVCTGWTGRQRNC